MEWVYGAILSVVIPFVACAIAMAAVGFAMWQGYKKDHGGFHKTVKRRLSK